MKLRLIALTLVATLLYGQKTGAPVYPVKYPADQPTQVFLYDANSNLTHVCSTGPIGSSSTDARYYYSLSRSATTLTNIVVLTNVGTVTTASAHGLRVGQLVTVSGATIDTDLNGTYYIQSTPSTTTFTITTSAVANATYTESTLTISGNAPRTTSAIWSIVHYVYDSNNLITDVQAAYGVAGNYTNICANAQVTTGATKITYK